MNVVVLKEPLAVEPDVMALARTAGDAMMKSSVERGNEFLKTNEENLVFGRTADGHFYPHNNAAKQLYEAIDDWRHSQASESTAIGEVCADAILHHGYEVVKAGFRRVGRLRLGKREFFVTLSKA